MNGKDDILRGALAEQRTIGTIQLSVLKYHTMIYAALAEIVARRLGSRFDEVDKSLKKLQFMTWVPLASLGLPAMKGLSAHLQRLDSVRNQAGHSVDNDSFVVKLKLLLKHLADDTQFEASSGKPLKLEEAGADGLAVAAGELHFRLYVMVYTIGYVIRENVVVVKESSD